MFLENSRGAQPDEAHLEEIARVMYFVHDLSIKGSSHLFVSQLFWTGVRALEGFACVYAQWCAALLHAAAQQIRSLPLHPPRSKGSAGLDSSSLAHPIWWPLHQRAPGRRWRTCLQRWSRWLGDWQRMRTYLLRLISPTEM